MRVGKRFSSRAVWVGAIVTGVVLAGGAVLAISAPAAKSGGQTTTPLLKRSSIHKRTVIAPDQSRYFYEPGTNVVSVLSPEVNTLRTLTVTDASSNPLRIENLFYDAQQHQLLMAAGGVTYAVDENGTATPLARPAPQGPAPVIAKTAEESLPVGDPAELAAKERAAEIAERVQRGETVSAADQAFLDEYNGPNVRSGHRVSAPDRSDPQTLADRARIAEIRARLEQGGTLTADEEAFIRDYERRARERSRERGLDDDGCDCTGTSYSSGTVDLPIPDNTGSSWCVFEGGYLSHTLVVPPGTGGISDVNIGLNLSHSYVGDISIAVEHNGTRVYLKTGLTESCENLSTVFDDEGGPYTFNDCPHTGCVVTSDFDGCGTSLLSAFDGMDASGNWTLLIEDEITVLTGILHDWTVCLNSGPVETAPVCGCPESGIGSGAVNIPIPDNTGDSNCDPLTGISHTITVPAGPGVVSDVNVSVNIAHTFIGDLVLDVTHNGTTVRLKTRGGFNPIEGCENLSTTFDDEGIGYIGGACPHTGCNRAVNRNAACGDHFLAAFDGMPAAGDWTLRVEDVVGADVGTLLDWSLCFNAPDLPRPCATCPAGTVASGAVDIPISDDTSDDFCSGANGISHTITVPEGFGGLVSDVNVGLNLSHTFVGDLVLDLTHNGVTVLLKSQGGSNEGCDDLTGTVFDDEGEVYAQGDCPHTACVQTADFRSCAGLTLLSAFDGMSPAGDWTLRVVDAAGSDVGILHDWHLCFETVPVPGFVAVDVQTPEFYCEDGVLSPNPFTYVIHATNTGEVACTNVNVALAVGAGPGGTAAVEISPPPIPVLNPGETVDLLYTVSVTPSGLPGCIGGGITITSDDCADYVIDAPFCLFTIPGCLPAEGPCECLDLVLALDVTNNMALPLNNLRNNWPGISNQINFITGGDVRYGLVTFRDIVSAPVDLTFDRNFMHAMLLSQIAAGGGAPPEPSDEALREIVTGDAACMDGSQFDSPYRSACTKHVVLITDAVPGGCDDVFTPDDVANAHQRALDAAAQGIRISSIYVPIMGINPEAVAVMQDYAATTGGFFFISDPAGFVIPQLLITMAINCGASTLPDDCLPEGPACSGQPPLIYTNLSGLIDDAVLSVREDSLVMAWSQVADAEFYQIYLGNPNDDPANYRPIATAFDTSIVLPLALLEENNAANVAGLFAQAKQSAQTLVGANLACWPLDAGFGEVAEDFAQDNNGTIVGAEWVASVPGHYCLRFEHGDYVDIPNNVEFYGQPLQVEACLTIEHYPTIHTGPYYIFAAHRYATWFGGFGLRINPQGRLFSQVWNDELQNWQSLWAPPGVQVPLGVPFLVTAVINGDNSLLLVNGEVVAAGVQDYGELNHGFHMTIGAHNYNDGNYQYHMRGDIHWLKVSQTADPD